MNAKFKQLIPCEVLRNNVQIVLDNLGTVPSDAGFIDIMNLSFEKTTDLLTPIEAYDEVIENIATHFHISPNHKIDLLKLLNQSVNIYVLLHMNQFSNIMYADLLSTLDKLTRSAAKLEKEILAADSDFFEQLEYMNHFEEKDENEPSVPQFFNALLSQLRILQNVRAGLNETHLGKFHKLGVPSRRKDIALDHWIGTLYDFWCISLGRDMKRDKMGIGGRKRFLDFLETCIIPLHPEIVSDPDSPQERLDTALKSFQRSLKVHGENASLN